MFDLIDESGKDLKLHGYKVTRCRRFGVCVAHLQIDSDKKSKSLGLEKGEYYIFNSPFLHELGQENERYLSNKISEKLASLLGGIGYKSSQKVLIACLGNPDIEADRLGKAVFDKIDICPIKNNKIFKFCPNIFYYTGIETADIIQMLAKHLDVSLVVIIDSLTTSSISRLGTSFQISSAGMTPGSGVNRFGRVINKDFLGVQCIAIGVPFMVNAKSIEPSSIDIILTPKDIKNNIERAGDIIAKVLQGALK